ncbi:MAG: hypothetical protein ACLQLH_05700 [Terracidiphilus sp.]
MSDYQNSSNKERIPLWPMWVAIGFPLLLIALEATPVAPDFFFVMVGVPALLLAWAAIAIWAAILAVRSFWRREWWRAVISAVLPLVVLGVGLRSMDFIRFCNNAGDTIHFYARYPAYVKAVRATPANGSARLLTINLGGMIWASRGFVYDESDEVLLPASMQSPGWKVRAQDSELGCGYGALPIPGPSEFTKHWYIASFAC